MNQLRLLLPSDIKVGLCFKRAPSCQVPAAYRICKPPPEDSQFYTVSRAILPIPGAYAGEYNMFIFTEGYMTRAGTGMDKVIIITEEEYYEFEEICKV